MGWLHSGVGQNCGVAAFVVSVVMLLAGLLVVLPVERAQAADGLELGPDGYFSALVDTDGDGQILPVIDNETGTAGTTNATGWANTRRIVFGKQGNTGTYGGARVSGGYKTLAKGEVLSEAGRSFYSATVPTNGWTASSTTSVAENEALLWADDVVTAGFAFAAGSDCSGSPCNSFDSASNSYQSNAAKVADDKDSANDVAGMNYSSFEQGLLRETADKVEGVCTAQQSSGCSSGSEPASPQFSPSINKYQVFPLSIGDVNKYFGHTSGDAADNNLRCKTNIDAGNTGNCANGASSFWLRSAYWSISYSPFYVRSDGGPYVSSSTALYGLRPAVRLSLGGLLLSADSGDQSQGMSGDVQLTFVETDKKLDTWSASVSGGVGSRMLSLSGSSDLGLDMGWKVVDPESNVVLGSGRTSTGGNMELPESKMTDGSKDYDLYVWGQQDGNATDGLTNKATVPVKTTITNWKVKLPDVPVSGDGRLGRVGVGDYSVNVTGQIDTAVVVMLPAGLVLDGHSAGGVSLWVGDNANLQVNTALVDASERVVVRLKNIGGSALLLSSGGLSLGYELRVNQQAALSSQSGDLLVAASSLDAPVSATLQARFTGGVVPQDAQSGNYRGQLTFQVTVEEKP